MRLRHNLTLGCYNRRKSLQTARRLESAHRRTVVQFNMNFIPVSHMLNDNDVSSGIWTRSELIGCWADSGAIASI
jgi:hypothetical protein